VHGASDGGEVTTRLLARAGVLEVTASRIGGYGDERIPTRERVPEDIVNFHGSPPVRAALPSKHALDNLPILSLGEGLVN
jgi:hypothetical protein